MTPDRARLSRNYHPRKEAPVKPILSLVAIFLLAGCTCRPLCQDRAAGCPPTPAATATPCACQHLAETRCGQGCGGAPAPCGGPCGGCPEAKGGEGGSHGPGCRGGPARMHEMMQHKMHDRAEAEKFFEEDDKQ